MRDQMMQDKARSCKTTIFGIGKVFSSTGQILFGIANSNDLLNLPSAAAWVFKSIGIASTTFSRSYTRFSALWKQFGEENEQENRWELPENYFKKGIVFLALLSGIITGLGISVQAYVGTKYMMKMVGTNNHQNGESIVKEMFSSYCALSSLLVFYIFVVKNSLQNTSHLLQSISSREEKINKELLLAGAKTVLVSGLGAFSYGGFLYFNIKTLLKSINMPKELDWLSDTIAFSCFFARFYSTVMSRVAETFKFFLYKNRQRIDLLSDKDKLHIFLLSSLGILDIFSYGYSYYSGSVVLLKDIKISKKIALYLSIPPALSASYLHYIFSIRRKIIQPMIKERLKAYQHLSDNFEEDKESKLDKLERNTEEKLGVNSVQSNVNFFDQAKTISLCDDSKEEHINVEEIPDRQTEENNQPVNKKVFRL